MKLPAAEPMSDGLVDVFAVWTDGTMHYKTYQNDLVRCTGICSCA